MNLKDKQALIDWDAHRRAIEMATVIDMDEDPFTKRARIERLKGNIEDFSKYYFPHYCKAEFAAFHKRFFKKAIKNKRIFITRAWSRAHAKSVCSGVLLPMFLWANHDLKNMILASYNWDNAAELLMPLQTEFESNQRLINDFGTQVGIGTWEKGKFITLNNCSFRAVGSGQSPRGTRNNEARPDFILFDDIDEDEMCRNPKRLDDGFDWLIGALRGCFDTIGTARFVGVGNIIAKDTLMKRCIALSDDHEQIDILYRTDQDKKLIQDIHKSIEACNEDSERRIWKECLSYAESGFVPSWSERNSLYDCVYMITKMGYRLSQREYFNNPITEGKTFKKEWIQFRELPPLRSYKFLVAYLDPGFKKTKTSDTKALILVGLQKGEFHIRKVFCGQASIEGMIDWAYTMNEFVKSRHATYLFKMEEVFLQSLLYKDFSEAARTKGYPLPVSGDTRKKPDKDERIAALSGYFERGSVYFDIEIEKDHHCMELVEQFLCFEPGVKTKKDGPDATEGAFHILSSNLVHSAEVSIGGKYINRHKV